MYNVSACMLTYLMQDFCNNHLFMIHAYSPIQAVKTMIRSTNTWSKNQITKRENITLLQHLNVFSA